MRGATMIGQTTLVVEECCRCSMLFAMPSEYKQQRLKKRDNFYCPAGHSLHYIGETEEQRLRRLLARQESISRQWEGEATTARRSLVATKGVVTRTKNRIAKGLCPCCNRRFADMASHMEAEHPGYAQEAAP